MTLWRYNSFAKGNTDLTGRHNDGQSLAASGLGRLAVPPGVSTHSNSNKAFLVCHNELREDVAQQGK
jgi:hypothetical protein